MDYIYQDDVLPIFLKFNTTPVEAREDYEKKIVNVKKPNYLNGSKKKELAERYLEYIENQTDKFLIEESNFNFSVIPVMYLDQPPSSMPEIDRNLKTVRKYMDDLSFTNNNINNNKNHNNNNNNNNSIPNQHNTMIYKRLIERLIDTVYKMIEIFKKESLYILYHDISKLEDQYSIDIYLQHPLIKVQNSISRSNNNQNNNSNNQNNNNKSASTTLISTMEIKNDFNFKEFKNSCLKVLNRLERKQTNLDLQCYKEIIKDISHLYTMQHYDKVFYSMDHSSISPDDPAVGVTGLVVNRLHRLENELKTIQQHWNGTMLNSHNLVYKR
ncbi:hypothetical protein CYY_002701 [Polysphondylium violaceum]|uniref:Uncharacterized protein n=1 Tax=Polysphondylium violaceum TaxID=133409 RepID=A0A8J4PZQ7_9MYCE|nr:hypothetical protein CYY_002701 [Polysphondylium violaceum]